MAYFSRFPLMAYDVKGDKKHKLLHMNPGAIGDFGIHTVKTILCFSIDGKEIKDLRVVEFPRSKIQL